MKKKGEIKEKGMRSQEEKPEHWLHYAPSPILLQSLDCLNITMSLFHQNGFLIKIFRIHCPFKIGFLVKITRFPDCLDIIARSKLPHHCIVCTKLQSSSEMSVQIVSAQLVFNPVIFNETQPQSIISVGLDDFASSSGTQC